MNFLSKSSSEDSDFENKYKNVCQWLRTIDNQNQRILNLLTILVDHDIKDSAESYYDTQKVPILEPGDA